MKGKQVLLAGGTGGLGLGVTPAVLARGADVTIPYRQPQEVERLKSHLSPEDFSRIRFVMADLREEAIVERLVNDMARVDVLIHLVGGFSMAKTHECRLEDWQQQFDINLTTAFLACKHSLRRMLETGYGRIVTVSSRAGVQPGAQLAAYSAAKAGVVALTQTIAAETKGLNITANTILPSVIDTPSNRHGVSDEIAQQWVSPGSLAEVICFLASDAAQDIRGAAVPVYGNV